MNDALWRSNNNIRLRFGAIPYVVTVHGRIKAPIPKHNCAIVGVPLGFHYGHAKEHETRGDCR
jgi:hypothetical protein